MLRRLAASLILIATAAAALPVFAEPGDDGGDLHARTINAQFNLDRVSRSGPPRVSAASDTTYVGFNPAYAGSNYWSIGVGAYRPLAGSNNARRGYWDFDVPLHGDTLQGWTPNRRVYTSSGALTLSDDVRPWWAVDIGNQVNAVGKSGPANARGQKRTDGVIGLWHSDPGSIIASSIPGTTPVAPSWAALSGARSAWCGIRAHGDLTAFDPITGNYYNGATAVSWGFNDTGSSGTSARYPGYCGQWDQMLYRDISIPSSGTLQVRFKYRSNMSTMVNLTNISRTGWFDKDPLVVVNGNYVKSTGNAAAPIDSFMVYLGRPVEAVTGDANDWTGSDGVDHDVYDPLRRWMAEVIHAFDGTHHELFTTFGDHGTTTQTVSYDAAALAAQGYGGTARIVFRVKTNRGGSSDDETGSNSGNYSSGRAGAAIVDDIEVNTGAGFVSIGTFEAPASPADSALTIDNDPAYSAAQRWKATGKPPATYFHAHDVGDLVYQDLCGPVGGDARVCNMNGMVVSMGDHEQSEQMHGLAGTTEREITEAIDSPTINLVTAGPSIPNDMGLTGDMVTVTEDYYIFYELYSGAFDPLLYGNFWQFGFHSYPAAQSDGVKCWGNVRYPSYSINNPSKQCFIDFEGGLANGLIRTSNANGIPDSMKIAIRLIGSCFRFGISANCNTTLGGYLDNFSLAFVDGGTPALIGLDLWQLFQDTFPANENSGLPGLAAFDTCAALVKSGLNTAQFTGNLNRLDIPGDSVVVLAAGNSAAIHLVFRINPGPGNYVTVGDPSTGLRKVPTSATPIASGDGSFWSAFITQNGDPSYPGAGGTNRHLSSGVFEKRWNPLAWNAARMDTADIFAHPVQKVGFNASPATGYYATTYHESDPKFGALGILRNICFVNDTAGALTNITCGRSNEPSWPPLWTNTVPATRTGIPAGKQSREGTKILPDGLFTPGTHVQYFFRREDGTNPVVMVPDTNLVYPQANEASNLDGHRWQQFSVLPDTWKKIAYGGGGLACMLVVDWNDGRGDELAWVSIADSIGATRPAKWGAHNGWHAAGGQDVNDPAARVTKNEQPGSTWDLYGVKGSSTYGSTVESGTIGARLGRRETSPSARAFGKDAKNAPTLAMLEAYYRILLIMTGDLMSTVFGPVNDKSSDDSGIITSWLLGSSSGVNRGLWLIGSGVVQSEVGEAWLANLSVSLGNGSYLNASGVPNGCVDLTTLPPITASADIYGVRSGCLYTNDVLTAQAGGSVAATYSTPGGTPYTASVYRGPAAPNYWASLVEGFDIKSLGNRFCDSPKGRSFHAANVFLNGFSSICSITGGSPLDFLDVPHGKSAFTDLVALRNNPVVTGELAIALTLARADRVTLRIYDVSGRLVRTVLDGRPFKAGEHLVRWDGADDAGRRVARGVYFAKTRYESRGFEVSRKAIVVK